MFRPENAMCRSYALGCVARPTTGDHAWQAGFSHQICLRLKNNL